MGHAGPPVGHASSSSPRNITESFTQRTGTRSAHLRRAVERLDPKLDIVFKLLLTRERRLLADMLEGVLARPVGMPTLIDSTLLGDRVGDKSVTYDVHARLYDGTRADVEMQRQVPAELLPRMIYYGARDYSVQLPRGDSYCSLAPVNVIVWLNEPLFPELDRLHSVFELRERHTNAPLGEYAGHVAIHVLQLHALPRTHSTGYAGKVERWARFLTACSDAELCELASEDPIMSLAKQTLDRLSEDPEVQFQARLRDDAIAFEQMRWDKATTKGVASTLLKLIRLRFGPLSKDTQQRISTARPEELEAWTERILTARHLDEVLVSVPAGRDLPEWLPARPIELTERQQRELLAERVRAQAELLLRQLDVRFGHMPAAVRVLVETARADQIREWAERILTASTLDEVLVPVPVPEWMKLFPQALEEAEDDPKLEHSEQAMASMRDSMRTVGRTDYLAEQLFLRFGPEALGSRARIHAKPGEIDEWAARVLTARTLAEVFAP